MNGIESVEREVERIGKVERKRVIRLRSEVNADDLPAALRVTHGRAACAAIKIEQPPSPPHHGSPEATDRRGRAHGAELFLVARLVVALVRRLRLVRLRLVLWRLDRCLGRRLGHAGSSLEVADDGDDEQADGDDEQDADEVAQVLDIGQRLSVAARRDFPRLALRVVVAPLRVRLDCKIG